MQGKSILITIHNIAQCAPDIKRVIVILIFNNKLNYSLENSWMIDSYKVHMCVFSLVDMKY